MPTLERGAECMHTLTDRSDCAEPRPETLSDTCYLCEAPIPTLDYSDDCGPTYGICAHPTDPPCEDDDPSCVGETVDGSELCGDAPTMGCTLDCATLRIDTCFYCPGTFWADTCMFCPETWGCMDTLDCPDTWDCSETLDCPDTRDRAPGTVSAMDFGDAPHPGYQTRLSDNGARHEIDGMHYLGLRVDGERDGQPNLTGTGDDVPGSSDDEDGVWFTTSLRPGERVPVIVEASAYGYLDMWLDADGDAKWIRGGEMIFVSWPLNPGFNQLSFRVPVTAVEGATFARFRFSSLGFLSYYGPASDGEIEDHFVAITETFGGAVKTNKILYTLGEEATIKFHVTAPATIRLAEERADGTVRVLWSGVVDSGTHRLQRVPITWEVGRGAVTLLAATASGNTTLVSTPFEVAKP